MSENIISNPEDLEKIAEEAKAEERTYQRYNKLPYVASGDIAISFSRRANKIGKWKWLVFIFLIFLLGLIVAFPSLYGSVSEKLCAQYDLKCALIPTFTSEEQHLDNMKVVLNDKQKFYDLIFYVFIIGKIVLFAFLISTFAWVAKIFNQLRRLEITYRDKAIVAETYLAFLIDSDDETISSMKDYALKTIFEPSLIQSERSKEACADDDHDNLSSALGKLLDLIAEKLKSK